MCHYCMHDLSRLKYLIELSNLLDISMSSDELEKEDVNLVQHILDRTGDHRVPVPPSIKSKTLIHCAEDNFDKSHGNSSSHGTILMFL